jgi:lipid II:glycine glycyltransferase (peptidoglycan interpeptide bridge formation enzyme)
LKNGNIKQLAKTAATKAKSRVQEVVVSIKKKSGLSQVRLVTCDIHLGGIMLLWSRGPLLVWMDLSIVAQHHHNSNEHDQGGPWASCI